MTDTETVLKEFDSPTSHTTDGLIRKLNKININIRLDQEHHKDLKGTSIEKEETEDASASANQRHKQYVPMPYFKQWSGKIISIEDDIHFLARISEISSNGVERIVRFDRNKISFENPNCFAEGASFFWKVGLFYENGKTAIKKSQIRFRMLPAPNPLLLKEAEKEFGNMFDLITWME